MNNITYVYMQVQSSMSAGDSEWQYSLAVSHCPCW